MVRRRDHDGVHVLVREQLLVVEVARDAVVGLAGLLGVVAVDEHLRVLHPPAVEVADGHDPRRVELPDARHVVAARDAPRADRPDVDAVARGGRAEDGRGHDRREARRDDGRGAGPARRHAERLAARDLAPACHGHSLENPIAKSLRQRRLRCLAAAPCRAARALGENAPTGDAAGLHDRRRLRHELGPGAGRRLRGRPRAGHGGLRLPVGRAGRAARPEGPAPRAPESRRLRARARAGGGRGARGGRGGAPASRDRP